MIGPGERLFACSSTEEERRERNRKRDGCLLLDEGRRRKGKGRLGGDEVRTGMNGYETESTQSSALFNLSISRNHTYIVHANQEKGEKTKFEGRDEISILLH